MGDTMRTDNGSPATIALLLLLVLATGLMPIASGSENKILPVSPGENTKNRITADFFYNPSCESCQKVLPVIQQYEKNSSLVSVNYLNIAIDNASSNRFTEMQKSLGHIHVPFVLIGNQYLVGQDSIIKNLDSLVKSSQ